MEENGTCCETENKECCPSTKTCCTESCEAPISTFDYVGFTDPDRVAASQKLRELCKMVESFLIDLPDFETRTFSDRCISIARSKLEECCMQGIKAIAFHGKKVR